MCCGALKGATEKAKKVRQCCVEVFRYAIVTGRAEYNPAPNLTSAMQGHESKHYPFLTTKELPDFFKALSGYTGSALVVLAARLLIITGLRTGELRGAFWDEIKISKAVWEIPASRMKMRRPHVVPLSRQALTLIGQIQELTGNYHTRQGGSMTRTSCQTVKSSVLRQCLSCLMVAVLQQLATR